jgi:hypothetical protein
MPQSYPHLPEDFAQALQAAPDQVLVLRPTLWRIGSWLILGASVCLAVSYTVVRILMTTEWAELWRLSFVGLFLAIGFFMGLLMMALALLSRYRLRKLLVPDLGLVELLPEGVVSFRWTEIAAVYIQSAISTPLRLQRGPDDSIISAYIDVATWWSLLWPRTTFIIIRDGVLVDGQPMRFAVNLDAALSNFENCVQLIARANVPT